jgi:aspartate carbamoyltransferase catalytic subunit
MARPRPPAARTLEENSRQRRDDPSVMSAGESGRFAPLPAVDTPLPAKPVPSWTRRHVLDLDDFQREEIELVLDTAEAMKEVLARDVPRVPALRGTTIVTLFYEASTRTRASFEHAAKVLGADVINLTASGSSVEKGESLIDTVRTLRAIGAQTLVMRHSMSGAPYLAAAHCEARVINAGDGWHAHPTQGLLDLYTIRHYKKDFTRLTVAVVGDVLHSRVARSLIHGLTILDVPEVRVIGPQTLLPAGVEALGVRVFHDMRAGLKDCDVVVMLRLQNERMRGALLPSAQEFFKHYGLTEDKLAAARSDAIVMHPGPMNRGVEIDSAVADGPRSVILPQVTFGIAVRMAVMSIVAGN